MPENPKLDLALTQITTNPQDGTLTINFTAKWGDGTPVTALADVEWIGAIVAWPASEYQSYKSEGTAVFGAGHHCECHQRHR